MRLDQAPRFSVGALSNSMSTAPDADEEAKGQGSSAMNVVNPPPMTTYKPLGKNYKGSKAKPPTSGNTIGLQSHMNKIGPMKLMGYEVGTKQKPSPLPK